MKRRSATRAALLLFRAFLVLLWATFGLSRCHAAETKPPTERELLETLRTGEPAEKAIACKQLAIYGTKLAVPDLAPLLSDPQLASWSRIALEAIPDPTAEAALVEAAGTLDGELLIGVINTLGVRASEPAVTALVGRLGDSNVAVAEAAAIALGRIGNAEALRALRSALAAAPSDPNSRAARKSAVAEGCILAAERLKEQGEAAQAIEVYDEVRQADLPAQRVREATLGAIVTRGADGIPLLLEQLRSSDSEAFALALTAARELPSQAVVDALSPELVSADPQRAAIIATVLGECATSGLPPAIAKAASEGEKPVRLAAIEVVGKLGDAGALPALLETAAGSDAELAQAATNALVALQGQPVDAEIVRRLRVAEGAALPLLITLVGRRHIGATDDLIEALAHDDWEVRRAALSALGATISADELRVLIQAVVEPKSDRDLQAAEKALIEAGIRMPDREATAAQLASAVEGASTPSQASLLRVLGAVGGSNALKAIADVVKGGDSELQDAGTRVLGAWMTADAGPVLLEISKDPATAKFQIRALRGYLRIARQLDMPPAARLAMCRSALEVAKRPEERKLVLDALERAPSLEALDVAYELLDDAAVKPEALETIVVIGEGLLRAAREAGETALEASPPKELAERAQALSRRRGPGRGR
jgi:HEAT repeat protein